MTPEISAQAIRAFVGSATATAIAIAGATLGLLTTSGSVAAAFVGGLSMAAGWQWGVALVLFFIASVALSKLGARTKLVRGAGIVGKPGARDAAQVLANGGLFAVLALGAASAKSPIWVAAAFGALAAATADTWATEIGMLFGATPRSITTFAPVATGTSGGVTAMGSAGGVAGAGAIALIALAFPPAGWTGIAGAAIALGGFTGMLADSILGATLQSRRMCVRCGALTEALTHTCGGRTRHERGIGWIDNDVVNACATLVGAVISGLFVHAAS